MDDIQALEPKVAKLDVQVEALTRDVASLSSSIRDLSEIVQKHWQQTEGQFQQVLVAIERASAPRKTDWHLVLGALGLILAIGAAAFSPLMLRLSDVQQDVDKTQINLKAHESLNLHPVGQTRVDALEADLKDRSLRNSEAIRDMDIKLQKEYTLIDSAIREKVLASDTALREKSALLDLTIREHHSMQDEALRDMDTKLQKEFSLLDTASQKRVDELTKHVENAVAAMQELQQRMSVLEALRAESVRVQKR
jgi:hypothetical protein